MEPITRQEQLLDSIATGDSVELEPITREEQYLSAIAGLTDFIPEKPITRKEMFYEKILESGGVGGGGDGTAKPEQTKTIEVTENGTYKVTPDSGKVLSSVTAKVNVPERYEEGFQAGVDSVKLQEKTVTENGDVLPDEGFSGMSKVTVAVPVKEEQEKTVTITENGTTEVIPDEGKTLSRVTVETNVAGSGGGSDEAIKAVVEGRATEIILPNNVNKMRDYSFYNYTSLITVKAAGLTSIGDNAFYGCKNLALTALPAGLTSIGDNAFDGCKNLALTELPAGLTTIEANAFRNCTNLALTELPAGLTSIGSSAFYKCTNLALTELPTGITTIDYNAFRECTNLALTELPAGITIIDYNAFYECTKLALTELPAGLTSIDSNAFYGCKNLKTITFKGTPTSINSIAFNKCTNITTINVPWAEGAVANAPWGATNATINYNYTGA